MISSVGGLCDQEGLHKDTIENLCRISGAQSWSGIPTCVEMVTHSPRSRSRKLLLTGRRGLLPGARYCGMIISPSPS